MNTQDKNETNVQYLAVCCCGPNTRRAIFWGIVLILLGGLGLLSTFVPLQHLGKYILPAFLLLWGSYILWDRRREPS